MDARPDAIWTLQKKRAKIEKAHRHFDAEGGTIHEERYLI